MRVGVIGTGGMGQLHARHVSEARGHLLAGVADIDRGRAEAIASANGECAVFTDGHALINDPRIEAVIVASPDPTHAPLVLECIRLGKPVLAEKPLAPTLGDAQTVVEAEVAGGRKLVQVGFMRLYDPAHLEVRRAIDDGTVGRLHLLNLWHRNAFPEPPLSRRGNIVAGAVHDFMTARWLFGREPGSVWSVGPDQTLGVDDQSTLESVTVIFDGGGIAVVESSMIAYAYEVGVQAVGDRAIVTTPLPPSAIVRNDAGVRQSVDRSWRTRFVPAYRAEVEEWLAGAAAGCDPSGPSAWDGYATLAVCEAAVRSIEVSAPVAVERMSRPAFYS